jgi:hypothetical protein
MAAWRRTEIVWSTGKRIVLMAQLIVLMERLLQVGEGRAMDATDSSELMR